MTDDLYDIRNAMVLGNYAQVISEGSSIKANPYKKQDEVEAALAERDLLVFKAHIGMNQLDIVIDDLSGASAPPTQAVRLLAQYLKADSRADEAGRQTARGAAAELAKAAEANGPPLQFGQVAVAAAALLIHAEDFEPALRLIRGALAVLGSGHPHLALELHALAVDIFLRIHRLDSALREHTEMCKLDDDATLSVLCGAWVHIAQGGEKAAEALQAFEELREKFGASVLLLNGMALAHMARGQFEAAEKLLLDAMSKRSGDPETLINLVTCSQHLKKGAELIARYITQLKNSHPHHPWVRNYVALEARFDKAAQQQSA